MLRADVAFVAERDRKSVETVQNELSSELRVGVQVHRSWVGRKPGRIGYTTAEPHFVMRDDSRGN